MLQRKRERTRPNRSHGTPASKLRPLPDYLQPGLDLVFVGFNPGERSARIGHYYAGIGNLFWQGLFRSGLISAPLGFSDDWRLPEFGIGLTDLAKQPSRSASDLPASEFRRGRRALLRKLCRVQPQVIAFNGKGVYELFSGHPCRLGAQTERPCGAAVFVLPSTSARNAAVSREEKLKWFCRLQRFLRSFRSGEEVCPPLESRAQREKPARVTAGADG